MSLRLRPLTLDDLPAVVEIERAAKKYPWSEAMLRREVEMGGVSRPLAAELAGRLAGFLMAWHVADEVHIINIVVHPEFQRRGVATALLDAELRRAQSEGACKVLLEVREHNTPAISLYKKLGFREAGLRPNYYTDSGENAIIMEKLIAERRKNGLV